MKVCLVTLPPSSHRTSEENLGILSIAANLRKHNIEVEVIDAWLENYTEEYVFNKLIDESILFIGFSSYMTNTLPTINIIKRLKEYNKEIQIVCGGFGPTFYIEEHLKSGADFISIGEGEETLLEIAEYYLGLRTKESIKSIAYIENNKVKLNELRPLLDDLDSLPFPSRDNLKTVMKRKSTVNMVTSRGCSGNCEFCSVIAFFRMTKGKIWRTRSINNIVDEIEELYKMGVKYIKFVDDSFIDGTRNEEWCKEFCEKIKEKNIHIYMRGQIRADKVTDKIMYYLKESGFFSFACGIENASDTSLTRMNKKATKKENQNALDIFKKYGIIVQMGYILFDKYTSIEELKENYEFLKKNDFTITKGIFSEMFSAEGTKLNDTLKSNDELVISDFIHTNNKYTINDEKVRKVYDALKSWHKSHSHIYDKCIDPLTAPKAIDMTLMKEFYKLALELKRVDLNFFDYSLKCIDQNKEIDTESKIKEYGSFYKEILEELEKLYNASGLIYDAKLNPFI